MRDQQQSVGEQTRAVTQNAVALVQDPAAGHNVLQQPLGLQGLNAPGGSQDTTAPMGGAGGAGAAITTGPRPGLQVMGATPNGVMCTMSPEVWQQLMMAGLLNFQPPTGVLQQQQVGPNALPMFQQPQPGPSGMQPGSGGMRTVPYVPKGQRDDSQRSMSPGEFWGTQSARSASYAGSGIKGLLLTEIRAEYDLTNYPHDSQVKFVIYTYVEVNGVRRLLKTRSIPE